MEISIPIIIIFEYWPSKPFSSFIFHIYLRLLAIGVCVLMFVAFHSEYMFRSREIKYSFRIILLLSLLVTLHIIPFSKLYRIDGKCVWWIRALILSGFNRYNRKTDIESVLFNSVFGFVRPNLIIQKEKKKKKKHGNRTE